MEKIRLTRLEPAQAARMLAGLESFDPAGTTTAQCVTEMTRAGQCFAAGSGQGGAVYVLRVKNGVAWVSACKGTGDTPWTDVLLPVIESQAAGCKAVAFQTARRGLVRKAKKQGYEVAGYIMKKTIQ